MAKIGRPSSYSKALADRICTRLADGESLNAICKDEKFPYKSTVCRWLQSSKLTAFHDQYRRARVAGWEARADSLIDLPSETVVEFFDDFGNKRIDSGSVQLANVKSRNLMWLLSKHMRGIYGDKPEPQKKDEVDKKPHEATEVIINAEPMPERYKT